jgi:hypothetical protein
VNCENQLSFSISPNVVVEQVVHSEMHSPSPESAENDKRLADMEATVTIISENGEFLGRWIVKNDS